MRIKTGILSIFIAFLVFCLPAALDARIVFSPIEAPDEELAERASRHFARAVGRRLLPDDHLKALIDREIGRRPWLDLEPENVFPVLARHSGADYWVSGSIRENGEGKLVFNYRATKIASGRSRLFRETLEPEPANRVFRDAGMKVRRYISWHRGHGLSDTRRIDTVELLREKQGSRQRGTVSVAVSTRKEHTEIIESIIEWSWAENAWVEKGEEELIVERNPDIESETTLEYYLSGAGYEVLDGETALLRNYADSHFDEGPWSFPRTLTADYFLIGQSKTRLAGELYPGLANAEAWLEIKLLDTKGELISRREIITHAPALSHQAAAERAIDMAVAETLYRFFPLPIPFCP